MKEEAPDPGKKNVLCTGLPFIVCAKINKKFPREPLICLLEGRCVCLLSRQTNAFILTKGT